MKTILGLAIILLASMGVALRAAAQPASSQPAALSPQRIEVVYLAPGRATTLQLSGNKTPPRIFVGAEIVAFEYEAATNQIRLRPRVDAGETNLNMTIDGQTYVFVLKIVGDVRVQYLRTFTIENASGEEDAGDEAGLGRAPPMRPVDVDIIHLVAEAERARGDPVYLKTKPNFRYRHLGKSYDWNDNVVTLVEVDQFIEKDLLLFKIEWVNRAKDALYLNARQYGIAVANQKIPVIAAMQDAPESIIFPGQHEVVWLAVQGYRLRRTNNWALTLPPEASAVTAMAR